MKPVVTIEYCPRCGWLLRAAYFAQELLTTFSDDLQGVMLEPSGTSGAFLIRLDGQVVFDRKKAGGFPETKVLKQMIRDVVNPSKHLGHADNRQHSDD